MRRITLPGRNRLPTIRALHARSILALIIGAVIAIGSACAAGSGGGNIDPVGPTQPNDIFYQLGEFVPQLSALESYPCTFRSGDRDLTSSEMLAVRKPKTLWNPTMDLAALLDPEQGIVIGHSNWEQFSVARVSVYRSCDGRQGNAYALWGAVRFNATTSINGMPVLGWPNGPGDSDWGWSRWYYWPLVTNGQPAHLRTSMPARYSPPPFQGTLSSSWSGQAKVCNPDGTDAQFLDGPHHWNYGYGFNTSPKDDDPNLMTAWVGGLPLHVRTKDLCGAGSPSVSASYSGHGYVCNVTGTTTVATFVSAAKFFSSENPASTYHDIQPWTQDATLVIMWDQGTRLVAPRADICAS